MSPQLQGFCSKRTCFPALAAQFTAQIAIVSLTPFPQRIGSAGIFDRAMHRSIAKLAFDVLGKCQTPDGDRFRPRSPEYFERGDPLTT